MRHHRGDEIRLRADIQNRLEDFALSKLFGAQGLDGDAPIFGVTVRVKNISGAVMPRWSLCQLGDYIIDPDVTDQGRRDPTVEALAPVWPDIFGTLAVVTHPIPDDKFGRALVYGICPATVDVITADDQFAAPDHSDPTQLKSCDTGEVRIFGSPAVGTRTPMVAVGFAHQVLWTYERTADYPGDDVELLSLENDLAFSGSDTVTLIDTRTLMDDQETGDRGLCQQIGSKFYAMQAVC